MTSAAWRPVLEGADATAARAVVREIADALCAEPAPAVIGGVADLADGWPGWALFLRECERTGNRPGSDADVSRLMEMAIAAAAPIADDPALLGGITGLAWAITYLGGTTAARHAVALDAVDDAFLSIVASPTEPATFDLVSGLVGLGVYALERLPRPGARAILSRVVAWFGARAESVDGGITWSTRPEDLHPDVARASPTGVHHPGVAHGTAGVAALLASVAKAGIDVEACRRLLDGSVRWLLACERYDAPGRFPLYVGSAGPAAAGRSGWCTGAPGIAWACHRAAEVLPHWRAPARALAARASRLRVDDTRVVDATLCHGSAGMALLSMRWYDATGEPWHREDARRWLAMVLGLHRPGNGVAGFAAVNAAADRREPRPGLLFGAAGIGLALLAAVHPVPPDWDRVLLLSSKPGAPAD